MATEHRCKGEQGEVQGAHSPRLSPLPSPLSSFLILSNLLLSPSHRQLSPSPAARLSPSSPTSCHPVVCHSPTSYTYSPSCSRVTIPFPPPPLGFQTLYTSQVYITLSSSYLSYSFLSPIFSLVSYICELNISNPSTSLLSPQTFLYLSFTPLCCLQ